MRYKYPLPVDLLFYSVGRTVVFSIDGAGCDPIMGCYNGGRCGILNLKCFSGLNEVGHFIRPGTHVFKTYWPLAKA